MNKTCQHVSKNGFYCGNNSLISSKYCYLKSHHPNIQEYEKLKAELYQNYLNQTQDHINFTVKDVIGDGACLYRCFTVHLLKNLKLVAEVNQEIYAEFLNLINVFFKLKLENSEIEVESWNNDEYQDKIANIINQKSLETNYYFVNKLAKYLQIKLKNWLVHNKDFTIEDLGGFTIEDLVKNCHDITLDQYDFLYEIYAGDVDYLLVKMNSDTEEEDDNHKQMTTRSHDHAKDEQLSTMSATEVDDDGSNKYKKIHIPDRWGSTSEIYAFSALFHSVINIYVIKRFDIKTCAVVIGKKLVKSSRIELYQRVELRSSGKKFSKELNLLLIEKEGFSHYQYLDKKNPDHPIQ